MARMQLRFDGVLGFPGGLVEEGESAVQGAMRELKEEAGLDVTKYRLSAKNHVQSYFNEKKQLVLHFFGLEVSIKEFQEIERNILNAEDFGGETMGILRPPLYTMQDRKRGLPAFLSNQFSGNAREEFLCGLAHFKILTPEEIETALVTAENLKKDLKERSF